MRKLTDHKVNSLNDLIDIAVVDEPGHGGASHVYEIHVDGDAASDVQLHFQNGPIIENGVNGISQEVLLAIVADRLRSFQDGPFSCRENALALTKVEEAMLWLHYRTRSRIERGVEGTTTP